MAVTALEDIPARAHVIDKEFSLGSQWGLAQGQSSGHTEGQLGFRPLPPGYFPYLPPQGGVSTPSILLSEVLLYGLPMASGHSHSPQCTSLDDKLYSHPIHDSLCDTVISILCTLSSANISIHGWTYR